ncbi:type I methionyl aminopeptidase [Candidatus Roizmanbacteria bacterium RIFCSPHIGHO2_02_FULL_40_13b]|uniref:Methionine aminopeptidase n=1 Tax=Candidatus Roizmanbacteria bacterium RIFCSPHIGHO2_01_FULL_39_24 TaxID=1802032 RepID=A0A1F7GLM0_9BACT|nr:MAG: type I methionyl aminopeptidase [Candidatus Roizmanbacteria bacterium RIFCSPHIGHO2_01_FULL_39_24]OGK27823.1 MAG: type I methionyl aminopeptidase [Candidatus Roizmanbacteria bacterium RIFCSPHIGHO2_02_FULL_40_13b]OGK49965.1 MAG: type I methionyl aminopeptidase [Candidatus Roizmanbacteria bacterium RIFCSPLOWO2_01_FULL_40_32]OGK55970.1 MAG: type I methionyl aminopeptidase [Candidatus Roizmanbacteria bacterium RIFCSPLOWO2_02_FULL_39_8]
MIHLKTPQEIELMKTGGMMLSMVVKEAAEFVRPGMTTKEIDDFATIRIGELGGGVSFNKVPGYKFATCLCVNEQVVHTPPSNYVLKAGDILTIDAGVFYKGFHTDKATTIVVGGNSKSEQTDFLKVGYEALGAGLGAVKQGNRIGNVSAAIERVFKGTGYWIMRDLTGHGVGRGLHEDPMVPGYVDRKIGKTPRIVPGMVLAIEVIYSMKKAHIVAEKGSDWSLITDNKSIAACFEDTIAVFENKTSILTRKYGKI